MQSETRASITKGLAFDLDLNLPPPEADADACPDACWSRARMKFCRRRRVRARGNKPNPTLQLYIKEGLASREELLRGAAFIDYCDVRGWWGWSGGGGWLHRILSGSFWSALLVARGWRVANSRFAHTIALFSSALVFLWIWIQFNWYGEGTTIYNTLISSFLQFLISVWCLSIEYFVLLLPLFLLLLFFFGKICFSSS